MDIPRNLPPFGGGFEQRQPRKYIRRGIRCGKNPDGCDPGSFHQHGSGRNPGGRRTSWRGLSGPYGLRNEITGMGRGEVASWYGRLVSWKCRRSRRRSGTPLETVEFRLCLFPSGFYDRWIRWDSSLQHWIPFVLTTSLSRRKSMFSFRQLTRPKNVSIVDRPSPLTPRRRPAHGKLS